MFAVFFFVACGEKSPEDVAKTFYESLMKADVEKALSCIEVGVNQKADAKGKVSMLIGFFQDEARKHGGVKSIDTKLINKDDTRAAVLVNVHMKNGKNKSERVGLYKKDGKWYIKL